MVTPARSAAGIARPCDRYDTYYFYYIQAQGITNAGLEGDAWERSHLRAPMPIDSKAWSTHTRAMPATERAGATIALDIESNLLKIPQPSQIPRKRSLALSQD
jgi:hypothetical protein